MSAPTCTVHKGRPGRYMFAQEVCCDWCDKGLPANHDEDIARLEAEIERVIFDTLRQPAKPFRFGSIAIRGVVAP